MKNFVKNKFDFSLVYFFIFILSSILTFIIGELYFFVPNGVDYVKYVKYLEFFGNKSDTTHTGQGLTYYFIVSFVSFIRKGGVSNLNIQNIMNSNIHSLQLKILKLIVRKKIKNLRKSSWKIA